MISAEIEAFHYRGRARRLLAIGLGCVVVMVLLLLIMFVLVDGGRKRAACAILSWPFFVGAVRCLIEAILDRRRARDLTPQPLELPKKLKGDRR